MDHKALLHRIGGRTRIDQSEIAGLEPARAIDHAVLAAAAFLAGDIAAANAHAGAALHQRPEMVSAPQLAARVFCHLPPDRFAVPGLHPWFGLQWMLQPRQTPDPDGVEALGAGLLAGGRDAPSCMARIFEQVCEARLRPSCQADPDTATWLGCFVDRHAGRSPAMAAFYRACLDHAAGDRDGAAQGFARCLAAAHPMSHATRGAASYLARPGARALRARGMRIIRLAQGRPIVVTADPVYFAQWVPLLLACLARTPPPVAVHVHIVGGPGLTLPDLPGDLADRVGLSVEADPGLGRAYYASARFIAAQNLLEAYGRPLLFSDIDAAFDPSVGAFMARLGPHPAAFLFKTTDNHFPWRSVPANLCYLSGDTRCWKMLEQMARYLGTVFDAPQDGRPLWWCDQNALAHALAETGLDRKAASVFGLRRAHGGLPFRFAPNAQDGKTRFRTVEMERVA